MMFELEMCLCILFSWVVAKILDILTTESGKVAGIDTILLGRM